MAVKAVGKPDTNAQSVELGGRIVTLRSLFVSQDE